MAKLVLSLNGAVQGEYELDRERITVGRKPDNDIQIDNLAVSGKHSMIITILDDSFLEDLGSTNGTYVNGKLVRKQALKDGDVISVGKHELRYISEAAEKEEGEFERTMIIKPGSANDAISAARAAEVSGAGTASSKFSGTSIGGKKMPLGCLTVLNGPIAGKELELHKALVTLGKPGTQIAVISRRPHGYFLTHIESKSGGFPVVNGSEIGAKAYQLQNKDTIELADIKMEFTIN